MEETCRDWRCFKQRIPVQGGFVLITGLSPRLFPSCIQHVRHRHSPGAPRTWGALPFPIRQSSAHPFRSSPGRWGPRSSPPTAVLGDGGGAQSPRPPLATSRQRLERPDAEWGAAANRGQCREPTGQSRVRRWPDQAVPPVCAEEPEPGASDFPSLAQAPFGKPGFRVGSWEGAGI